MTKYTQKQIKAFVNDGIAVDCTTQDGNRHDIIPENYDKIGVSVGIYGTNGALYKGESGQLYAVTARTSNLFILG